MLVLSVFGIIAVSKKKEVRISMERDVDDEIIRAAIERAGYTVTEIR